MFWGPLPQPRDAPPSAPQPPILASAPSPPGGAPCWPRPPSSSLAVRAARSRASKGAARAGRWLWRCWKGEESRPPPEQFQPAAAERAARRERGGLAPLVRPERSLLFPARSLHAGTVTAAGGEDGRRASGVVEKRGDCLSCSPRRSSWGSGTWEAAPTGHGTLLPEGQTNFLSARLEASASVRSHLQGCGEATLALRA